MKVAIVHDWLTGMRGGEKVLEVLCEIFPQSEIFTLIHHKGKVSPVIERIKIHTSFLQKFPLLEQNYRNYLPLFPAAIESFNLRGFDLVVSSSHCVAKSAKKPKDALHICYCYTPMRYAWMFFEQYFKDYSLWKKNLIRGVVERLKKWDIKTLSRVDEFVAISQTVKVRIKNIYKRDAAVIYPPVDVENFSINPHVKREDFYLCVSALVAYKRIDLIVSAFNEMKDKRIFIVGDGNLRKQLEKSKISDNIVFLGWLGESTLINLYQRARAFIYMAEEDFGIAPLEAQATGLPVIAYGKGGVTETVIAYQKQEDSPTGLLVSSQDSRSLIDGIFEFDKHRALFDPQKLRINALKFSRINFKNNIKSFIENKVGKLMQ